MTQPATHQNTNKPHVWPTSLLLHQALSMPFSCIKCNGIPILCKNNEDGEILCSKCAENVADVAPCKAVQKMINNLKTKCLSLKPAWQPSDDNVEGGNIVVTQIQITDNKCDWVGMIKDWKDHSKECQYVSIRCDECKNFECQRKLMGKHVTDCPEARINCPLSCGFAIFRKNTKMHLLNDCSEQIMDCCNDDCKMQMKRQNFDNHVNNECDARVIACEFAKYGCKIKQIKANQLKHHMNEYKFNHLLNKCDFIHTQFNNKISELTKTVNEKVSKISTLQQQNRMTTQELNAQIMKQNQIISTLRQDINTLTMYSTPTIANVKCENIANTECTIKWNAAFPIDSKLFMKIEKVNDVIDEKTEEPMDSELILFDKNKKNYQYKMDGLKEDTSYEMKMTFCEFENDNEKNIVAIGRKDISPFIFSFKTSKNNFKVGDRVSIVNSQNKWSIAEIIKHKKKTERFSQHDLLDLTISQRKQLGKFNSTEGICFRYEGVNERWAQNKWIFIGTNTICNCTGDDCTNDLHKIKHQKKQTGINARRGPRQISMIVVYDDLKKRVVLKNNPKKDLYEYTMNTLTSKLRKKYGYKGLTGHINLTTEDGQLIEKDQHIVQYLFEYKGEVLIT